MRRRNKIIAVAIAVAACSLISIREYDRGRTVRQEAVASGGASIPCIDFRQAKSHAGETGCVSGYVLRAYTSRSGNTFLDFCADYRNCPFSSVIFASDRKNFGNLETLAGREVQIRGLITAYQGRAEIVVRNPWQLQVGQ
ncbi:MAG: hypothetical protein ACRD1O_05610 [Terriglobia bacterium]